MFKSLFSVFLIATSLCFSGYAASKVLLNKEEALELAFPDAQKIEQVQVFLSENQVEQIENLARTKLESRFYTFYKGLKKGEVTGYVFIDTHKLRTKTETVMYVINKDGTLRHAEFLAFFEPEEYQAGERWVQLFENKPIGDSMRIGRDIPNLTGATISARAFAAATRKALSIFKIAVLKN